MQTTTAWDGERRAKVLPVRSPNLNGCVVRWAKSIKILVEEFFEANPPLVRLADGSQWSGNILLKPREETPDAFDRERLRTLDWDGMDLFKESMWREGQVRADSIQLRVIRHLVQTDATFVIDDDDTGESADGVVIDEQADRIVVHLWHCKNASGNEPWQRVKDLCEVRGQAQKIGEVDSEPPPAHHPPDHARDGAQAGSGHTNRARVAARSISPIG